MRKKLVIGALGYVCLLLGCQTKGITRSNSYKGYSVVELFYNGRGKIPVSIQIYVFREEFKKLKHYFVVKDIYTVQQSSTLLYKRILAKKRKDNKLFLGGDSSDSSINLSDQDLIIIDRFNFLVDSLRWPAINNGNTIRGFNMVDPKKTE